MTRKDSKNILLLIFMGIIFFILGNNVIPLTNPDEAFYALSAKEMIHHNTWFVPYIFNLPHFEKPILTFWLLRLSYALFGINNFAARFSTSAFAILGVIATYFLGRLIFKDTKKSLYCSIVLLSSALYIGLSRFVLTDMIFSILILLSLISFYAGYVNSGHQRKGIIGFFIFSAMAVLTKGLLGIIFPAAVILAFLTIRRDWKYFYTSSVWIGLALFLLIALPWYLFMIKQFGYGFIHEFFYNDHIRRVFEAEHSGNDKWYFYPLIMTAGILPWSIFEIMGLFQLGRHYRKNPHNAGYLFLICWIVCVFGICQIAHSKLASYILPLFPALALVTGDYLCDMIANNKKRFVYLTNISLGIFVVLAIAVYILSTGIIHAFDYYQYLPDKTFAMAFLGIVLVIALGVNILMFKHRYKQSVALLSLQVMILLFFGFFIKGKFDPFISSKQVSAYLLNQPQQKGRVLCSKMFARGVRFFTNKDIAIVGGQFFSPHPVPVLKEESQLAQFFHDQTESYAIVREGDLDLIERAAKGRYKVETLTHLGDAYLLSIVLD